MSIPMEKNIPHSATAPREYPNEIDVVSVILNLQDGHPLKVLSFYNLKGSNDIKTVLEDVTTDKYTVIFGDFIAMENLENIWKNCVHCNIADKSIE